MQKIKYLVFFACFFLSGCYTLDKEFVGAVDSAWEQIGPKYKSYLESDEVMSEELRQAYLRHMRQFGLLIEDAKNL